jgi:CcmD family protein
MTGTWKYVFLAYGIVWAAIVFYVYSLKRRYRRAEAELKELQSDGQK